MINQPSLHEIGSLVRKAVVAWSNRQGVELDYSVATIPIVHDWLIDLRSGLRAMQWVPQEVFLLGAYAEDRVRSSLSILWEDGVRSEWHCRLWRKELRQSP